MNEFFEAVRAPWPWYTSGAIIAAVMFTLIFFGKSFGFSSNFRTICAISGGGKQCEFFDFNWRNQIWNLFFLVGTVIGGILAGTVLSDGTAVQISEATLTDLSALGISAPEGMQPKEIFSWEALTTGYGWIMLAAGGFLVGFGARYGGGCTSGHAISGISNMQLPSLVAVIGFFIGGLFTTYVLLPLLLG